MATMSDFKIQCFTLTAFSVDLHKVACCHREVDTGGDTARIDIGESDGTGLVGRGVQVVPLVYPRVQNVGVHIFTPGNRSNKNYIKRPTSSVY